MIAELFYPKQLKRVVSDLRARGDLNERALEKINRLCFSYIFLTVLLVFSSYLIFENIWTTLIIVIFAPFFISWDINREFRQKFAPYVLGKKIKSLFVKKSSFRYGNKFYFSNLGKTKKFITAELKERVDDNYEIKNQNIYLHDDKYIMPDFKSIKNTYCLSKSRIGQ